MTQPHAPAAAQLDDQRAVIGLNLLIQRVLAREGMSVNALALERADEPVARAQRILSADLPATAAIARAALAGASASPLRVVSALAADAIGEPLRQALDAAEIPVGTIPWIGKPTLHFPSASLEARKPADRLRIGHSIRHVLGGDGTITMFLKLPGARNVHLLTSGHVATCCGDAAAGDQVARLCRRPRHEDEIKIVGILVAAESELANAYPVGAQPAWFLTRL
ncbi:hypothetical protein [Xanthobacter sp. KR7-225]|uniref:hypothetical protein n=1 Tax=Xanthobacter sp. KR7-225 TaxID=3156613 RepID=UPI0032B4111C